MAVDQLYNTMKVTAQFNIRRYWFKPDTDASVLARLNIRYSSFKPVDSYTIRCPYVDINYYGDSDPYITRMELLFGDYILAREAIAYTVEGDDGL